MLALVTSTAKISGLSHDWSHCKIVFVHYVGCGRSVATFALDVCKVGRLGNGGESSGNTEADCVALHATGVGSHADVGESVKRFAVASAVPCAVGCAVTFSAGLASCITWGRAANAEHSMVRVAIDGDRALRSWTADRLPLSTEFRKDLHLIWTFEAIPLQSDLVVGGLCVNEIGRGGNPAWRREWLMARICAGSLQEREAREDKTRNDPPRSQAGCGR